MQHQGKKPDQGLAARYRAAFAWRQQKLGLPRRQIAADLGVDNSSLADGLAGRSRFYYELAVMLDAYFRERNLPGFLAELLPVEKPKWSEREIDPATVAKSHKWALTIAQGLRQTRGSVFSFLADKGMFERVHILALDAHGGVKLEHSGEEIPVRVHPSALYRDVRALSEPELGAMIHRQALKAAQEDRITGHRIVSDAIGYDRLACPVHSSLVVTFPLVFSQERPVELH